MTFLPPRTLGCRPGAGFPQGHALLLGAAIVLSRSFHDSNQCCLALFLKHLHGRKEYPHMYCSIPSFWLDPGPFLVLLFTKGMYIIVLSSFQLTLPSKQLTSSSLGRGRELSSVVELPRFSIALTLVKQLTLR